MINFLFNILFFLIPLAFFKSTSESFEFSKIITLYSFSVLIVTAWVIKSIKSGKIIFIRTLLDKPLLIYLSVYLLSTIISIDPRTSWLGYYSRFNGGFISQICFALLYWAFVSNMDSRQTVKALHFSFYSTLISALIGIFEHFGIFTTCAPIIASLIKDPVNKVEMDKYQLLDVFGKVKYLFTTKCFEQDLQNRVFSTFGQPNWLAAGIAALVPLTWSNMIGSDKKVLKKYFNLYNLFWFLSSVVFFVTLLFTKSRSGLLAFGIEFTIFWAIIFYKNGKKYISEFFVIISTILVLFFALNFNLFNKQNKTEIPDVGPALETGGTESGVIRKYVWQGAFRIFQNYPILGTGPETFAYAFPQYKSPEHNLTSEWNFVYNKAHNEYLNYMANTGLLGIISYLFLISVALIQIYKSEKIMLFAGYTSILVTNFFGFSVVPISLLFFLIPAISVSIDENSSNQILQKRKMSSSKIFLILLSLVLASLGIYSIFKYYQADIYYNIARKYNRQKSSDNAIKSINKALEISPNEGLYVAELALADSKVETAVKAQNLNPYSQNIRRILVNNLVKDSDKNKGNLLLAEGALKDSLSISPSDPLLYYQLGILQIKINKGSEGLENIKKSVELKSNYKEARYALGLIYIDLKDYQKAKENLLYILTNIDPKDELTKKYLDQVNSSLK